MNDSFPEGYFYSFSHTATSLSSELFSIPQHCPAPSPAEPAHTSNARPLASQQRYKMWGLTQINPFSPEPPNQRSSSNLLLKWSQEQRTEVGGGMCSENSNVSKPEASMKESSPHAAACFFRLRSRHAAIFSLCIRQIFFFQNEVLGHSLAYLLSTPEHVHGGENHPAGLRVSGKIPGEITKRKI